MPNPRYDLTVRRDGPFWFVSIPAIDGATQARNLDEIDEMARDYISAITDVPVESIEIGATTFDLGPGVTAHLNRARELSSEELRLRREAADERRAAARALKKQKLTNRDIGVMLGISHQRVAQLVG